MSRSPLLALLCVGSLACGGGGECGPDACEAYCVEQADALRAAVPPGGELLTPEEARALAPSLLEIRAGVRLVEGGLQLCRGVDRCEEPWTGGSRPEPGDYVVTAHVAVPRIGSWRVEYDRTCTRGGVEVERGGGPIPLVAPPDGGTIDLGVLDRLRVGARGRTADEVTCVYRLSTTDGPPFEREILVSVPRPRATGP